MGKSFRRKRTQTRKKRPGNNTKSNVKKRRVDSRRRTRRGGMFAKGLARMGAATRTGLARMGAPKRTAAQVFAPGTPGNLVAAAKMPNFFTGAMPGAVGTPGLAVNPKTNLIIKQRDLLTKQLADLDTQLKALSEKPPNYLDEKQPPSDGVVQNAGVVFAGLVSIANRADALLPVKIKAKALVVVASLVKMSIGVELIGALGVTGQPIANFIGGMIDESLRIICKQVFTATERTDNFRNINFESGFSSNTAIMNMNSTFLVAFVLFMIGAFKFIIDTDIRNPDAFIVKLKSEYPQFNTIMVVLKDVNERLTSWLNPTSFEMLLAADNIYYDLYYKDPLQTAIQVGLSTPREQP